MSRIRSAVRAHQLREETAGEFVDWVFVETMTLGGPIIYLMMESADILTKCKILHNGRDGVSRRRCTPNFVGCDHKHRTPPHHL